MEDMEVDTMVVIIPVIYSLTVTKLDAITIDILKLLYFFIIL